MIELSRRQRAVVFHRDKNQPSWKGKASLVAENLHGPGCFWGIGDTFKEAAMYVGNYVPQAKVWAEGLPDGF